MPLSLSPVKQLVWPGRGPAPAARLAFPRMVSGDNPRTSIVPASKFYNRVRVNTATLNYDRIVLGAATGNLFLSVAEAGISDGDNLSVVVEEGTDFFAAHAQYRAWDNSIDIIRVDVSKIGGVVGKNRMSLAGAAIVYIDLLREDLPSISRVVQCLQTTYSANVDLTQQIPLDDTIPLITEGTQVLSQDIVLAAPNKVLCQVCMWGQGDSNGTVFIISIFRGTTCIQAMGGNCDNLSSAVGSYSVNFLDSPGVGAQTYSVRVGANNGLFRLNGAMSGRLFGGATACTLTLMEIVA